MKRYEELPQLIEESLSGLKADRQLFQRAMEKAAPRRPQWQGWQRAVALACSLVFVLGIGAAALQLIQGRQPTLHTQKAGDGQLPGQQRASDVPRGSIQLSTTGSTPGYVGVWAAAKGANFPMIRVDERYYRLLNNPTSIGEGLLGAELGQVAAQLDEPALDTSGGTISNVILEGSPVYAIRGMEGSAVTAPLDGRLRVFQRVAFDGQALIGREGLADSLRGRVVGLQLSGVGTIKDEAVAQGLMATLVSEASYQGSASRASDQALLIEYDSGIVLQLAVRGSTLMGCGSWEAQSFLDAFTKAVGR